MRKCLLTLMYILGAVVVPAKSDSYVPMGLQQTEPEPQPSEPPPQFSCDRLDQVPASQRCAFIRDSCESDSRIPYTEWYYCHVAPAGIVPSFLFTLLLAILLPLYFTLLGDTAEIYFSPIMTHISQSIPKMRPRFAGVTFVAMGNGATDLSANISAIRNGDVLLSAGALTGAAMFVQCVVASEVMRASRYPVKCQGATLRDLGIYSVSILMVLATFARGKITYWFIAGAVLLYLVYAVWVFVGDEWHERGRPRAGTLWRRFRSTVEDRLSSRWGRQAEDMLPWALVETGPGAAGGAGDRDELSSPLVAMAGSGGGGAGAGGISSRPGSPEGGAPGRGGRGGSQAHRHHHLISAKAYQDMVWADLNPEEPGLVGLEDGDGNGYGAAARQRRPRRRRPQGRESRSGAKPLSYSQGKVRAGGNSSGGGGMGPAAGAHVEMGSAPLAAPAGAVSGGAGGSQLVTLSSLDGSALNAPAPVDGTPAAPSGVGRGTWTSAGAPATTAASSGGGGAVDWASAGPQRATEEAPSGWRLAQTDGAWAAAGGASASGTESGDEYDSDDDSREDEEAGLLGRGRHGGADGRLSESDGGSAVSSRLGEQGGGLRRWTRLWRRVKYDLTVGASEEWSDLPPRSLRRGWRTATFPVLLPAYAAIRLTIPFVDPATYSRSWLLAACVGAPVLFALYVNPSSILAALIALAAGAALAAAVAYLTAGEEDALPDLDFGTGFAFGPAFFAVLGFCMGIIWIGTLASEAVGVIVLLAGLLRIPASVMGLTLLAWGNSLGDLFSNPAMARRGQPTMALTACFAGPLFNMLSSMALGFASYFAKRHVASAAVVLRPEVALGCVFLVLYNAAVAVVGLMNHGSLPERFYVFARLWYAAYFTIACVLGLWAGQD